jgi:DNA-binding transcriptional LysR family regulator
MGLEDIGTFVEAVERGSLTAAARELGVPKSTVSRRIARLEKDLGHELIRRSSRTFRLTEVGEAFYRRSAPAIKDLAEATQTIADVGSEPEGDLRITAPIDLGSSPSLVAHLVAFRAAYPKVRLVIDLSDRFVDVAAEGFDVALRIHQAPLEDRTTLKVRRVGPFTVGLYASPAYLDRVGRPTHPSELARHEVVGISRLGTDERWMLRRAQSKPMPFAVRASLVTTNMSFVPAALEAGAGIGLVANFIAQPALARGSLERVLPEWEVPAASLSIVWPETRHASSRLRAFLDFTAEHLKPPGCP